MGKAKSIRFGNFVEVQPMTLEEFKNYVIGCNAHTVDSNIKGYVVSSTDEQGGDSFYTEEEFRKTYNIIE